MKPAPIFKSLRRAALGILLAGLPAFASGPRAEPLAVVHGGSGTARGTGKVYTDQAAAAALKALKEGRSALDAAIAGTLVLEDNPRFNAGTGANIRMDGKTVQMDAAVADGATGRFGAVAAIERVKNPVLVARKVMDSPHVLIVGDGATRFARAMGFPDYDPICPESLARYERVKRILTGKEAGDISDWNSYDWKKAWNFPTPLQEVVKRIEGSPDTVGTVTRDAEGRFAAAVSTGGVTITFYGRAGDVVCFGAGIFAGPRGAVVCTGEGEEIIRRLVSKSVYDQLAQGVLPQKAVDGALAAFPGDQDLGIIAVSAKGYGGGCNYDAADNTYTRDRKRFPGLMAWSAAK